MSGMKLAAGEVLVATGEAISSTWVGAAGFVAGMGALGAATDLMGSEAGSGTTYTIVGVLAGYHLLFAMLSNTGQRPVVERGKRFGAYFGLSLLAGLAILLGLVALIIPGIVLLVRWLPAYSILLCENTTVTDALSESWTRTRDSFWALLSVCLMMVIAFIAAVTIYSAHDISPEISEELAITVGNLCFALYTVIWTAVGAAVYRLLCADRHVGEVFA